VAIARRHRLALVEDAACAIGSEVRIAGEWARVGRPHGDIACFSFHPRKVMSTGDGGMATTSDPNVAQRLRLLRQHGMTINDRERHTSDRVRFEEHSVIGFNYRMTDIQAAVGREQLKRVPDMVEERRRIALHYTTALDDVDGIEPPNEPDWARSNYQSYIIGLPHGVDQRDFMQSLLDCGVASRRGIMNAHRERPYQCGLELPVSEWAQDRHVAIPLYNSMTGDDVNYVVGQIDRLAQLSSGSVPHLTSMSDASTWPT
jgi:dTDP-4-amino-4,6-dideoxygalactose transaminase